MAKFTELLLCVRHSSQTERNIKSFNLQNNPIGLCYYYDVYVTEEETHTQKGCNLPKPHSSGRLGGSVG